MFSPGGPSVAQHWPATPLEETGQFITDPHRTVARVHVVPTHSCPGAHPSSLRLIQLVLQVVSDAQPKLFGQMPGAEAMQDPLPLHLPDGVKVTPSAIGMQDEIPHDVPDDRKRQAPTPSHVPSRPQGFELSTLHSPSGSVIAVTGRQSPFGAPVFVIEQAIHAPVQALSQHTPSMQALD